jgi:hypothetical protein
MARLEKQTTKLFAQWRKIKGVRGREKQSPRAANVSGRKGSTRIKITKQGKFEIWPRCYVAASKIKITERGKFEIWARGNGGDHWRAFARCAFCRHASEQNFALARVEVNSTPHIVQTSFCAGVEGATRVDSKRCTVF